MSHFRNTYTGQIVGTSHIEKTVNKDGVEKHYNYNFVNVVYKDKNDNNTIGLKVASLFYNPDEIDCKPSDKQISFEVMTFVDNGKTSRELIRVEKLS